MKPDIPWIRLWLPRGESLPTEDGAFTAREWLLRGTKVAPLPDLIPVCGMLVLCAEPGMGKTSELRKWISAHESRARIIKLEGRLLHSPEHLKSELFENPEWDSWIRSDETLTVILDGLDEALVQIKNLLLLTEGWLKGKVPLDRLRLIIACRSFEWPEAQGARLRSLWKHSDEAYIHELCPLSITDVGEAAISRRVDRDDFLNSIFKGDYAALAAKPITLLMLLDLWEKDGVLPQSSTTLYAEAIQRMLTEHEPERAELERNRMPPEILRGLAGRVAAHMTLTGAGSFVVNDRNTPATEGITRIHDFLPPVARAGDLTRDQLTTLFKASALFTPMGTNAFGFSHKSYAEFLAAEHLREKPVVQLISLFCIRDTSGTRAISPPLAETAAWLVTMHRSFRDEVFRMEPELMLRADPACLPDAIKADLTSAILDKALKGNLSDTDAVRKKLAGLNHPGISARLRPVINDSESNVIAFRLACEIADECGATDLSDDLFAQATNASLDGYRRKWAAGALTKVLPEDRVAELIPLTQVEDAEEPVLQIKEHALHRLLKKHWSVADALRSCPFPPKWSFFWYGGFEKHLGENDTLPLLKCFTGLLQEGGISDDQRHMRTLFEAVYLSACERMDEPEIFEALIKLRAAGVSWQSRHLLAPFTEWPPIEPWERRRKLAVGVLNTMGAEDYDYHDLHSLRDILRSEDFPGLLDAVEALAHRGRAKLWHIAAGWLWQDPSLLQVNDVNVYAAAKHCPDFAEALSDLIGFSVLGSEAAEYKKARHYKFLDLKKRREARKDPTSEELLRHAVAELVAGKPRRWGHFWWALRSKHESHWRNRVENHATWATLPEQVRGQAANAAVDFLFAYENHPIAPNNEVAIMACCGFSLLFESLDTTPGLESKIFGQWLDAFLGSDFMEEEDRRLRFSALYRRNPAKTLQSWLRLIKECDQPELKSFSIIQDAGLSLDSHISEALTETLCHFENPDAFFGALYAVHQLSEPLTIRVIEVAWARYIGSNHPVESRQTLALIVISLEYGSVDQINRTLTALEGDVNLAKSAWLRFCSSLRNDGMGRWSPSQISRTAEMLWKHFPANEDPPSPKGCYTPTPQQELIQVRNRMASLLASLGTQEACDELLRLADKIPDQTLWMRWHYRESLTTFRSRIWRPIPHAEIRAILDNPVTLHIASDEDLKEALLISLERYQAELKANPDATLDPLWKWEGGGQNRKNYEHNDEAALRNQVTKWLSSDLGSSGIICNREVLLRAGSLTDIFVEHSTSPSADKPVTKYTVVIEVKGYWNQKLETDIQTQLADRYLKQNGHRCGIYLVGWFGQKADNKFTSQNFRNARDELASWARPLNRSGLDISAVLLDCARA